MTKTHVTLPADRPHITSGTMLAIIENFSKRLMEDEAVAVKLKASNMIFRLSYWDDDWGEVVPSITADCRGGKIERIVGPIEACELKPNAELIMHGFSAHMFWMQHLNLMVAVTRQEILIKGELQKILRLVPIMKPGYGYYRETLAALGLKELLSYPPEKKPEPIEAPGEAPAGESSAPKKGLLAGLWGRIISLFRRQADR